MPQRHRPELAESIAGEPLIGYRRVPRTFRPDRTCAAPDCMTHLSIYNADDYCATHAPYGLWPLPGPLKRILGDEAPRLLEHDRRQPFEHEPRQDEVAVASS
jgi:hypothetical protein